jgi:ElaB/YqjD/DUF883 family membrane-anchored ribosome-binding protein
MAYSLRLPMSRRCLMPTLTDVTTVADAVKERLDSGLRQIEQKVEQGRRVMARGREAAEDGVAAAALQVRRHPLRVVAGVTAAAAMLGWVVGFVLGRRARR